MKKSTKITLASVSALLLLGGSGYAIYNSQQDKQDNVQLEVDDNKSNKSSDSTKSEKADVDTSSSSNSGSNATVNSNKSSATTSDNVEPTKGSTIAANIELIESAVNGFNNFNIASNESYNETVDELKDLNVTVNDNVKGPFGTYDSPNGQDPDIVVTGVVMDSDVVKTDGGYDFNLTVRVGKSPVIDDVDYTVNELKDALVSDSFGGVESKVTYHLKVSDDGKSGELSRTSEGQWW